MPTVFTHALAAAALGRAVVTSRKTPARFWPLAVLCAVAPDFDVIGFAFGVRYGDALGHRGFTHSLAFALLLGLAVARLGFRHAAPPLKRWPLVIFFFFATASHGLLDALTDGGLGVAFFWPFNSTRYFLPWRPVEVSPIGAGFFSGRGLQVLLSEVVWVWVPSALLVAFAGFVRRLRGRAL